VSMVPLTMACALCRALSDAPPSRASPAEGPPVRMCTADSLVAVGAGLLLNRELSYPPSRAPAG
jgi:hypothetical protein